ncbi:hypothetical protein A2U01_0046995, partial [Trifolium medium]|nr:hypothetical protein [Trifolium medium]
MVRLNRDSMHLMDEASGYNCGRANTTIEVGALTQGFVMGNVDDASFKEHNCYGVGMCLRDARG